MNELKFFVIRLSLLSLIATTISMMVLFTVFTTWHFAIFEVPTQITLQEWIPAFRATIGTGVGLGILMTFIIYLWELSDA